MVLNKPELFDKDVRFRYLAALCLAECNDWEECLSVIGAEDTPDMLKCKVRQPRGDCMTQQCVHERVFLLKRGFVAMFGVASASVRA